MSLGISHAGRDTLQDGRGSFCIQEWAHAAAVQGDFVGFNTGNGEKLCNSQAAGLAWLYWL